MIALVCIAKNEDRYIDEWIDYHLSLGFDEIFVYMNNWRINHYNPHVHLREWDGTAIQVEAYNDFIQRDGARYDWAAFFDVDEFLVLKKHPSIGAFLAEYPYHAICINWVLYGDNGLLHYDTRPVRERFTRRQTGVNHHVKTILRPKQVKMVNPHSCDRGAFSPDGLFIAGPFSPDGSDATAQLNHYFCKTHDEFLQKVRRGRPDISGASRTEEDFNFHNRNDREDT